MSAASYGLRTPTGTDLINTGDDDISFNAERLAQLLDIMAFRQSSTIPANTDMNLFTVGGYHYTGDATNTATLKNLGINYPSIIINMPSTAYVNAQIQMPYGVNSGFLFRTGLGNGTMTPWTKLGKAWDRGELPLNSNPYLMRGPEFAGAWSISGAGTSSTIQGTPPPGMASWLPGQIVITGSGGGNTNLSTIVYTPYAPPGTAHMVWTTTISSYSLTGESAWAPWLNLAGGSAPLYGAGVPNEMRIQAFKDANPLVTTGNKGAVILRFDHGLTPFKSTIWPLLQSRSLKALIAMNSRLWTIAENSGASQADAKAWIATGLVDFSNHTSDHIDRNTGAGIYDTIVNGRKELETQLSTVIHGFTVPGVTEYDKFGGFGGGTLDTYSETLAGSLILANHAVCSGAIGPIHRVMDGIVRQGGRHFGIEQSTYAEIKAQVDAAIANKTAVTLMMHPRNLNASGYISTAVLTQALDYIKAQIDAGKLANISYYQSHHAKL